MFSLACCQFFKLISQKKCVVIKNTIFSSKQVRVNQTLSRMELLRISLTINHIFRKKFNIFCLLFVLSQLPTTKKSWFCYSNPWKELKFQILYFLRRKLRFYANSVYEKNHLDIFSLFFYCFDFIWIESFILLKVVLRKENLQISCI